MAEAPNGQPRPHAPHGMGAAPRERQVAAQTHGAQQRSSSSSPTSAQPTGEVQRGAGQSSTFNGAHSSRTSGTATFRPSESSWGKPPVAPSDSTHLLQSHTVSTPPLDTDNQRRSPPPAPRASQRSPCFTELLSIIVDVVANHPSAGSCHFYVCVDHVDRSVVHVDKLDVTNSVYEQQAM